MVNFCVEINSQFNLFFVQFPIYINMFMLMKIKFYMDNHFKITYGQNENQLSFLINKYIAN